MDSKYIKFLVTIEGVETEKRGGRVVNRTVFPYYLTGVSYHDEPGYKIKKFSYNRDRSKAQEFSKIAAEAIQEQLSKPGYGKYYPSAKVISNKLEAAA